MQASEWGACPVRYSCTPGTAWSEVICDAVCGVEGGYCMPYTEQEERFCWTHPAATDFCDVEGNPIWPTWCLPYFQP